MVMKRERSLAHTNDATGHDEDGCVEDPVGKQSVISTMA